MWDINSEGMDVDVREGFLKLKVPLGIHGLASQLAAMYYDVWNCS